MFAVIAHALSLFNGCDCVIAAPGLGNYVEALFKKGSCEFNVRFLLLSTSCKTYVNVAEHCRGAKTSSVSYSGIYDGFLDYSGRGFSRPV